MAITLNERGFVMNMDQCKRCALRIAHDQQLDLMVANSPTEAMFAKLMLLIRENMSETDAASAEEMLVQLLDATTPSGNSNGNGSGNSAVAQDAAYLKRFPDANRLRRF